MPGFFVSFMSLPRLVYLILISAIAVHPLRSQSACGTEHTGPGVFICYPAVDKRHHDSPIPSNFHLSAQANARGNVRIAHYSVLVNNRRIYELRLASPVEQLSIEANLNAPLRAGAHTLRLVVEGVGAADVGPIEFKAPERLSLCDPFSRIEARICMPEKSGEAMRWNPGPQSSSPSAFADYLNAYSRNLKSVEADGADAVAVDRAGYLYTASHLFAGLELRKYAPNGSVMIDRVVSACSPGYTSVSGLSLDSKGGLWIAGTTTACLPTIADAPARNRSASAKPRGFVAFLDAAKPAAAIKLTYLLTAESRVAALRTDDKGNVYVAGTTTSSDFPQASILGSGRESSSSEAQSGFVCSLGQNLEVRWSALMPGVEWKALAFDHSSILHAAGNNRQRSIVLAGLTSGNGKMSYLETLKPSLRPRALSAGPGKLSLIAEEPHASSSNLLLASFQPRPGLALRTEPLPTPLNTQPAGAFQLALDAWSAGS